MYRAYLKHGPYKVGWVLNGSAAKCLVCSVKFGYFLRRHHCRSCGLIICNACSKTKAMVDELDENSKTRICDICVSICESINSENRMSRVVVSATADGIVVDDGKIENMSDHEIMADNSAEVHAIENNTSGVSELSEAQCGTHPISTVSPSLVREIAVLGFDGDDDSSDDESEVSNHYISTVSPTLVRKLALVGFNEDNNTSDDDDTNVPTDYSGSSENVVENDSFLSASGSSLGEQSAQRCFLDDTNSSASSLACSISPIHKRTPVMRTPKNLRRRPSEISANVLHERCNEASENQAEVGRPSAPSRRRSLGELIGATTNFFSSNKVLNREEESYKCSDSEGLEGFSDVSASGSSVGSDSARRYFLGSDVSTIASFNSLSPNGEDVIIHDTFHSPSFTAKTPLSDSSRKAWSRSSKQDMENTYDTADKENLNTPPAVAQGSTTTINI